MLAYIIIPVAILLIVVLFILYRKSNQNEKYVPEYTGNSPNYRTCSKSYRLYSMNESDNIDQKDRCKTCKGYNNIQFENFCPHNCRQNGVSLCDQGRIM